MKTLWVDASESFASDRPPEKGELEEDKRRQIIIGGVAQPQWGTTFDEKIPHHKDNKGDLPFDITQRPLALAAESPFSSDSRRQTAAHIPVSPLSRFKPVTSLGQALCREITPFCSSYMGGLSVLKSRK